MTSLGKWPARLGTVLAGVALTILVPVAAWATSDPIVADIAQRRRGGILGGIVWLCCLAVVIVVIGVVALVLMRRSRPPRS
ncbi:MAG TPA: hypothetical protein VF174_00695 [Micromonosporaceae bacterium]